jgi:autotransporter-associated beta strand protein
MGASRFSGSFSPVRSAVKTCPQSLTLGDSTGITTFAGVISGSGGLIKDGASTQTLTGANTYTGGTMLNGGTLKLSGASGALTLSGAAGARVIDFGATSGVLTFASLTADSSLPLQIWNWSGNTVTGNGTDRLFITNGYAPSNISFFSDSGTTLYSGATTSSGTELVPGELVPVPEASTLLGVLGLMAPLAWRERRHWMRCREARG